MLVAGIGTGMGVGYLVRAHGTGDYLALPSEGGIVKMPIYSCQDSKFKDFLKKDKKIARTDASMLLGGCGLPLIAEFLCLNAESGQKEIYANSLLFQDVSFSMII